MIIVVDPCHRHILQRIPAPRESHPVIRTMKKEEHGLSDGQESTGAFAQIGHLEELYALFFSELDIPSINRALRQWKAVYREIWARRSLDKQTPPGRLRPHHSGMARKLRLSHVS